MSDKKPSIYERLLMAAAEFEQPKFDSVNTYKGNRYASLAEVTRCVRPHLLKYGLLLSQACEWAGENENAIVVRTVVFDADGDSISLGYYPVQFGKPQENGTGVTYARRYALCAAFGLVPEEDTDGEEGGKKHAEKERPFIAKCHSCGARYEFKTRRHMEAMKCCKAPDWRIEA